MEPAEGGPEALAGAEARRGRNRWERRHYRRDVRRLCARGREALVRCGRKRRELLQFLALNGERKNEKKRKNAADLQFGAHGGLPSCEVVTLLDA